TVVRALLGAKERAPDMDALTRSRTLRQLLDRLVALVAPDAAPAPVADSASLREAASAGERLPFDGEPATASPIGRLIVRPVPAPPISQHAGLARGGIVLVVDDHEGVGERLAGLLRQRAHQVVRVSAGGDGKASGAEDTLVADLSRSDEVARLVEALHT